MLFVKMNKTWKASMFSGYCKKCITFAFLHLFHTLFSNSSFVQLQIFLNLPPYKIKQHLEKLSQEKRKKRIQENWNLLFRCNKRWVNNLILFPNKPIQSPPGKWRCFGLRVQADITTLMILHITPTTFTAYFRINPSWNAIHIVLHFQIIFCNNIFV